MRRGTTLLLALVLVFAAPAAMADAPAFVPIQGFLTSQLGTPIDGEVQLTLKLYTSDVGGPAIFTEVQSIMVDDGFFTLFLGAVETLDLSAFRDNGTLFLGIAVGAETEMAPRLVMGTVPYAGFAQYAGEMDWADVVNVPAEVTAGDTLTGLSCADGQVAKWDTAGSAWVCGDSGGADTLSGLSCASGQVAKWNGAAWACADDIDTGFSTEGDLTALLDDNYMSSSYAPAWEDITGIPADIADGDSDTTYSATAPITLSGANEFGLAGGGVTSAHIAADAVGASELADNSVTSANIVNGTITYTDTNTDSVQRRVTGTCVAGSSIRAINSNGTVTCETDDNTAAPGTNFEIWGGTSWTKNNASSNIRSFGCSSRLNVGSSGDAYFYHEFPIPDIFADRNVTIDSVTIQYNCTSGEYIGYSVIANQSSLSGYGHLLSDTNDYSGSGEYTMNVNSTFAGAVFVALQVNANDAGGDCNVMWRANYHY